MTPEKSQPDPRCLAIGRWQGLWVVGYVEDERGRPRLRPAYEYRAELLQSAGQVGIETKVQPLAGCAKLSLDGVFPDTVPVYAHALAKTTQQAVTHAVRSCEHVIEAMRAAESGILLASH
jgi:hypothetical protein